MSTNQLDVLFIWHLHQPYYGVADQGDFELPWVRLHAVKSYYDMAWLMAENPEMRATFNFSGSLLRQLQEWVEEGRRDRWWHLTLAPFEELSAVDRRAIVHHFFSLNHAHGVRSLPRYAELLDARQALGEEACTMRWGAEEFGDLQMLFNLAWCGFAAAETYGQIGAWRQKGRGFSQEDRRALLELQLEIMARVLPLYRELWEREQIEVSVSPMYHPILPLLIDTDAALRATPDRPTPPRLQAPNDARRQIVQALELAESCFGRRPRGIWPSEGSVSPEAVAHLGEAGVHWIASDEDILARSMELERDRDLWRAWRLEAAPQAAIFFRDHGLSDRLGFAYSHRPAEEAADDLIASLEGIALAAAGARPMAAIILDGENPWEHYPGDGRPFLQALYDRFADHARLHPSTPSAHLAQGGDPGTLGHLHSGSWILGNYQIWIGHAETNLAWELVGQTRRWLSAQPEPEDDNARGQRAKRAAEEALLMAEGSDWFWWYGDDFSSEQDALFDAIFRSLLRRVYEVLGGEVPERLNLPIHSIESAPTIAAHRPPTRCISPRIDGRRGGFFDWEGAGSYLPQSGYGSMFETTRYVDQLLYGFDAEHLYIRVDPGPDLGADLHLELLIEVQGRHVRLILNPQADDPSAKMARETASPIVTMAYQQCWELQLSRAELGCPEPGELRMRLKVCSGEMELRMQPADGPLRIELGQGEAPGGDWFV